MGIKNSPETLKNQGFSYFRAINYGGEDGI